MAPSNEFILRAIVGFIVEDESKMARDSRRRARRGMLRIYTPRRDWLGPRAGVHEVFPAPRANSKPETKFLREVLGMFLRAENFR